jgi:hypothetical protein
MIEDKITAILNCAQYLSQTQALPTSIIKEMIYSQLKDCSFTDIKKIANDENIDMLFLITDTDESNNEEKNRTKQQKRRKKKRDNERVCTSKSR